MSDKHELRERRYELEQMLESSSWHSRAYHNHFEDYTEVTETTSSGRTRIRRIYIGPYYRADMTDLQWKLRRLLYVFLTALSFALYVFFARQNISANMTVYVTFPEALSLFGYILAGWLMILRVFAPRLMNRREYNEAVRDIKLASIAETILLGICAVATLIHYLMTEGIFQELAQATAFLAAGACMFFIWHLERSTKYVFVSNGLNDTNGEGDMS